ncbi:tetratricopeptide repeat protein [Haliangium sp.]|uniref:tetratricopeptide repeat protein n=1 Tax=Haliangium sp. TaxID=2663208 RepID=UPI003D0A90D5
MATPDATAVVHWQRVEEVVDAVLELDPAQRQAYLAEHCGDDETLLREVEALLAADAGAGTFLERPAVAGEGLRGVASSGVEGAAGQDPDCAVPSGPVGPYRITRTLGVGGMGSVYLARRSDDEFDREVAIKILRPDLNRRSLVRRFRDERQILANLDHPNIAKLYEGGTTDDGRPYLVMEYIAGLPIDRYADERGLSIRDRVALFRDVCDAVHHAHQALIVHLDIKPSNVLVTEAGEAKLLDFGIAKLLDPEQVARPGEATQTGLRPLTPAYASPEQLAGMALTTASDVYSLGVMLYKLLTGRLPRPGRGHGPGEAWPGSDPDVLPRPSHVVGGDGAERSLRRQLRGDLDSIVLRALRPEPGRRYRSAEQLSTDLQCYLDGRPVEARKGTLSYRAGKLLRRHKFAGAVASLILALIVGFAVTTAVQAARLEEQRRRAEWERENTEQVLAFLTALFNVADPFEGGGRTATATEILEEGVRRLDQGLEARPPVQAKLRDTLGTIYLNLGEYGRAETLLDEAVAQRGAWYGEDSLPVAQSLVKLASVHLFRGEFEQAEIHSRRALRIREARLQPPHMDLAESLHTLASVYYFQARLEPARDLYERAIAIAEQAATTTDEHIDVGTIMGALGGIYIRLGNYERAEELQLAAIQRFEAHRTGESLDLAFAWNDLAWLYIETEKYDQAEPLLVRAAEVAERLLGSQHPHLGRITRNRAKLALARGDLERAEQHYLRALAIFEDVHPPEHADVCQTVLALLDIRARLDRRADAEALRARFPEAALAACPSS